MRQKKYLVEFIAQWIRDPDLRKRVLYKEQTELLKEYEDDQKDALVSLQKALIIQKFVDELDSIINLDEVYRAVYGGGGGGPPSPSSAKRKATAEIDAAYQEFVGKVKRISGADPSMFAGAAYEEILPHVRDVQPRSIDANTPTAINVKGHGMNERVRIEFKKDDQVIEGEVASFSSDVDVWQHVKVIVALPEGHWTVRAIVLDKSPNHKSTEDAYIDVNP